jgi:hypothetical protein
MPAVKFQSQPASVAAGMDCPGARAKRSRAAIRGAVRVQGLGPGDGRSQRGRGTNWPRRTIPSKPKATSSLQEGLGISYRSHALAYPDSETLLLHDLTEIRRLGQTEENDLLAGGRADVVVQAPHLDAGDLVDHLFQERACRFDQVGPDLLEQLPPFLGRERLDQLLFGGGQHALKADHEEITEQVGVDVLGTPAHVVLLEATDSFANGGFEFSPCSHSDTPP